MRRRRLAVAALALAPAAMPALAAQDQCRTIRAMTNADGRDFAGLSLGVARSPYRLMLGNRPADALAPPEDCSLAVYPDNINLSCQWRPPGDYAAATGLFDAFFSRFQQCLENRLSPSVGPRPYGNATALRQSETELRVPRGVARVGLFLIEAPPSQDIAGYHYVTLSVDYSVADEEEGEE